MFQSGCTSSTMGCIDATVALRFVGFTRAELDTVVIQYFEPETDFAMPIFADTVLSDSVVFEQIGDTLKPIYDGAPELAAGRDYAIIVLTTGQRTTVSRIVQEGEHGNTIRHLWLSRVEPVGCINAVLGFTQDGQSIVVPDPEIRGASAVIKR